MGWPVTIGVTACCAVPVAGIVTKLLNRYFETTPLNGPSSKSG